ncbi:DUF1700 domain-containing protein [Anaerorhabdus furcosa]|uniref:Uncharacterized membrane protein n=1 Tax=Anaerorhabdus furcosa TaxID=118967 RepID=A0A1T4K696_9FIRM|nr:DUF1700 domain-containing protein [Anaerorhabdus furcosa]SJZ37853.1 Uncharacterized membrane protein [Anaerorhabdus furcosa]
MNKQEFLERLENLLNKLSPSEREKAISYYSEMIEDFIEDGCTQEEAVIKVGTPGQIAETILSEDVSNKSKKESTPAKKMLIATLIVLGSPFWGAFVLMGLMLLLTGFCLLLVGYMLLWTIPFLMGTLTVVSVILSVVSTLGSFAIMQSNLALGLTQFGVGVIASGLFILLAISTGMISKYFVVITKNVWGWVDINCLQRLRGIKLW